MASPATESHGIDISRLAAQFKAEDDEQRRVRLALHREAENQLGQAVGYLKDLPEVERIITWGSILRPEQFNELSDIDICVAGTFSQKRWSEIEKTLLGIVTYPLDLVRWETLLTEHRERIVARGKVVYESNR